MSIKRKVFFVSDGTGITAETLGNSLLTQFEQIQFDTKTIPYVDSSEKASAVKAQLDAVDQTLYGRPIVFSTLVDPHSQAIIENSPAKHFDCLKTFLIPLELELAIKSNYRVGQSHGVTNSLAYKNRIEAINYALAQDDGAKVSHYSTADVILLGVSRSGKTPTCLYLALQYGIMPANYPLVEEDLAKEQLPSCLMAHKTKLFGLTINPENLAEIRRERLPNSQYCSLSQCQRETHATETLYQQYQIPCLNTTRYSIEEIATKIIATMGLVKRL